MQHTCNKKKAGIITVYRNINFGSNLQSYALQRTLEKLGIYAENICLNESYKKNSVATRLYNEIKFLLKLVIKKGIDLEKAKRAHRFAKYVEKHINVGNYTCDEIDMMEKKGKFVYDFFVCGSDQIWAPNQFRAHFFLSFTKRKSAKIAYAPSIGLPKIPLELVASYQELISDFGKLSIRENEGASLIKEITGINVPVVLDPTLLLDRKEWLAHCKHKTIKDKYILCYFLGNNEIHRKCVEHYSKKTGYKIYVLPSDTQKIEWGDKMLYNVGPKEFINLLNNSQIMCTDSFHGTIFSINLHKEFCTFLRFEQNDPLNQNSRIHSILTETKLLDRLVATPEEGIKNFAPIDWDNVDNTINEKRDISINYLKEATK